MKITKIEKKNGIYYVTFEPNWLERLFNIKPKTEGYKDGSATYTFGGGRVYYRRDGKELGNKNWIGEAIDRYRQSW